MGTPPKVKPEAERRVELIEKARAEHKARVQREALQAEDRAVDAALREARLPILSHAEILGK